MPVQPHGHRWDLPISLDDASDTPFYLQIARSISADILEGRLSAGDALPGSRTLAQALGVHRNTVLASYTELVTEGWLRTEIAGGIYAASSLYPSSRPLAGATIPIQSQSGEPSLMVGSYPSVEALKTRRATQKSLVRNCPV